MTSRDFNPETDTPSNPTNWPVVIAAIGGPGLGLGLSMLGFTLLQQVVTMGLVVAVGVGVALYRVRVLGQ